MSTIKLKVIKGDDTPPVYAQGEYHADLSGASVEVYPAFAEHLVALGYAEYYAKDLKAIAEAREVPEDAPRFVERETATPAEYITPAQAAAPPIPTEEITIAADGGDTTIAAMTAEPKNKKRGSK